MAFVIKSLRVTALGDDQEQKLSKQAAQLLGVKPSDIEQLIINRKSLDARKRTHIVYEYTVSVRLKDEATYRPPANAAIVKYEEESIPDPLAEFCDMKWNGRHRPVVVGTGPCGIFAALVLTEAGAAPIILERGETVAERTKSVQQLSTHGRFNARSNYCFGEGGAGTFSDGKLTCSRRHPYVSYLFDKWVKFGAPEQILYDSLPHIGSDNLAIMAEQMRAYILQRGGTFMFNTALTAIAEGGACCRYRLTLEGGEMLPCDQLILAIGHAARDTYRMLHDFGLKLAPKAFAVGTRVEHPQELIDAIQYGKGAGALPASSYKLTAQTGERGVWSFCMCPGGMLLPTGSEAEHLSVNGMSYYKRSSGFANAALVVNIKEADFMQDSPLDGIVFQENLEKAAYQWGGGGYIMPAQRLTDFYKGRTTSTAMRTSYRPGILSARIDQLLPAFITTSIQQALPLFNQKMKGFLSDEGHVIGIETKTSAPLTLLRNENHQSVSHAGIFPAGEGAGYAGGIVSAALDGILTAQMVLHDGMGK